MIQPAARALLIAGAAWGAFAFGAVYPWGYWPLCGAAVGVGAIGTAVGARQLPRGVALAFAAIALAVALQLVPMSTSLVARVSPDAPAIQSQARLQTVPPRSLTLSISPPHTLLALELFVAFALLTVGAASLFSVAGTTRVLSGILIVGVLLAIEAMVQNAVGNGMALGFWVPRQGGTPFGPFVNHNHFAGWMLMAVPLSLGLMCATLSRQTRDVPESSRERLLWLGSTAGSTVVLMAGGVAVMLLSIFLTTSRSGMAGALGATALTLVLVRRRYGGWVRIGVVAALLIIVIAIVAWTGVDQIVVRFHDAVATDYAGRQGVWLDAWRLARRYPIAGSGLDTYGTAMLFYQQFNPAVYYDAAHNDYLQLIAEGGVLVGIPIAATIAALALTIRRRFKEEVSQSTFWIRAGATIGLISIAIQEAGDFSLQIPGNAFLFAIVCAIAIHRTPQRRRA